ncbi:hypothetical protein ARALYDRAFT_484296, partial [Arabidopsis lyrata subsp. lyrata]
LSALRLRNANTPAPELDEFSDQIPSESRRAMSNTLTSAANLSNLLPTGTLLAFQLLTLVFTSNGVCDLATPSFTDSVKAEDVTIYFDFVTFKGMWVVDYPDLSGLGLPDETVKIRKLNRLPVYPITPDLAKYRMWVVDWIHATLSVLVFGAVALRDKYITDCFCPSPEAETKHVLDIVPVGVGVMCSLLFMVFPARRHGIGYLVTGSVDRR